MRFRVKTVLSALLLVGMAAMYVAPVRASFPGINGQVSFARFNSDIGDFQVWVSNPDGSQQLELTTLPSRHPNWSPGGNLIAFDFFDGQNDQLAVIHPDGTGFQQLTFDDNVFHTAPAWSPDGTKLVFESDGGSPTGEGLYIMNLATGSTARITANPFGGVDELPQWSPDGSLITFTRSRPASNNSPEMRAIFLVAPNGTGLRQLSPAGLYTRNSSWSPDSKTVVFNGGAGVPPPASIYSIGRDGSALKVLIKATDHQAYTYPRYSPDGTKLLFSFQSDDRSQPFDLWVANADGSNPTQISAVGHRIRFADWGSHPLQ